RKRLLNFEVRCWDQVDLELFDIVEEYKDNFYTLLGVEPTVKTSDIRKAYRRLSLQLHPDKNKEPDAEFKFRRLVAVAEVLKDEDKRKRYDAILRDGLPDWRQPVFYYRRVRKMGFIEFFILLFFILTIGHFIVIWSIYLEKKFEMEELISSKKKRDDKKKRKAKVDITDDDITELADILVHETGVSRPTFFDLLPFKIVRSSISFWSSLPARYRAYKAYLEEEKQRKLEEELELQEEAEEVEQPRPRRRQHVTLPEAAPDDDDSTWVGAPVTNMIEPEERDQDEDNLNTKSHEWTDEDFSRLSRAMVKFPGATPKRWVKIAQELGMTVEMVTKQLKKIRQHQGVSTGDTGKSVSQGAPGKLITSRKAATIAEDVATKAYPDNPVIQSTVQNVDQKSSAPANESSAEKPDKVSGTVMWTQNQQKLLEMALQQFPKTTPDRWTWIARNVPGMSKEDCIARYKTLVELMRQKKGAS
ncbi:dnaJ homolog subfamily C member 1-like, partial [Actinia tenebrosa]|uniref:DnaJ homolog subfamily C member 1-like n=1 Tax=Actinia tenebrosa TaxID=6105 RepID=A0A6P8HYX9_ACTTE